MTPQLLAATQTAIVNDLLDVRTLSRQVLDAHRAEDGRRLHEVCELISDLLEHLEEHLRVERRAAFAPLRILREDHVQVRLLLSDLRCLTCGFTAPEGACDTWRKLWGRLASLEARLLAQLALEESFRAPSAA